MAQINVQIPSNGIVEKLLVDVKRLTPVHVMVQMAIKGHNPGDGNIWKMTKTGRTLSADNHFISLEKNGITDGVDVELLEFPI